MLRPTNFRLISGIVLSLAATACGAGSPIGTVHLGDLVYSGTVDGDYLARQLIQLDPPFQACYVRVKRTPPAPEGVIELALTGGNGELSGEITANSTGSSELGECLLGAISGLKITEPEESAPWDYTAEWSVTFEIIRSTPDGN